MSKPNVLSLPQWVFKAAFGEYYKTVVAILRVCHEVEYKVPGKPETWDQYHEGQADLAGKIQNLIEEQL